MDKIIKIKPNDASIWTEKAFLLEKIGNYKAALKCHEKRLELCKRSRETHPDALYYIKYDIKNISSI